MYKRSYAIGLVLAYLLLLLAYGGLRFGGLTLDLSTVQYILFIPFVLLLWSAMRTKLQFTTPLFLFVLCAGSVSALYAFSLTKSAQTPYIIAKFSGDELEKKTRIFREGVNERLEQLGALPVGRFYRDLKRDEDLSALLGEVGGLGVITGDDSYLTLHFAFHEDTKPKSYFFVHDWSSKPIVFKAIRYVPRIHVPQTPAGSTIDFFAHLLSAKRPPEDLQGYSELSLRAAGGIRAPWVSGAHLAYPWWKLGNDFLERALGGESPERGFQLCAERAYVQAGSFLRPHDNPILRAAIFQNKALLLVEQAARKGQRKKLKEAKKLLVNARNFLARATLSQDEKGTLRVVKGNLKRLEALLEVS